MPGPARTKLPTLPGDVATLIVRQLSCRELYSLMSTCKAFWAWGSTIDFVEVFEKAPAATRRRPASQPAIASFLPFQHRRAPLGLKVCSPRWLCHVLVLDLKGGLSFLRFQHRRAPGLKVCAPRLLCHVPVLDLRDGLSFLRFQHRRAPGLKVCTPRWLCHVLVLDLKGGLFCR